MTKPKDQDGSAQQRTISTIPSPKSHIHTWLKGDKCNLGPRVRIALTHAKRARILIFGKRVDLKSMRCVPTGFTWQGSS